MFRSIPAISITLDETPVISVFIFGIIFFSLSAMSVISVVKPLTELMRNSCTSGFLLRSSPIKSIR